MRQIDDPQTSIGQVPPLFPQEKPQDGQEAQSGNIRHARGRPKARARDSVLQASLAGRVRCPQAALRGPASRWTPAPYATRSGPLMPMPGRRWFRSARRRGIAGLDAIANLFWDRTDCNAIWGAAKTATPNRKVHPLHGGWPSRSRRSCMSPLPCAPSTLAGLAVNRGAPFVHSTFFRGPKGWRACRLCRAGRFDRPEKLWLG